MRQGILVVTALGTVFAGISGAAAQPMPVPVPPPGYYDSRAYYPPPPPVARYAVAPPIEAGMPPYEVARVLRRNGFMPLGGPSRRGDYFTVSAIHPNGDDGRVVIDAYSGRVVRFVPASRFIRGHGNDEMVMVYSGSTFPPSDVGRGVRGPPPVAVVPPPVIRAQPTARPPQVASRTPSAAPVTTPKPRPQAAPKNPATAQAPPATAPQAAKPAEEVKPAPVAAPPAETKPIEAKPSAPAAPAIAPTQAMPPVQTME